jgi:hypothetical protein
MNSASTHRSSGLLGFFINLINKIMERPDFYPIKYYHKKRRTKHYWHSL